MYPCFTSILSFFYYPMPGMNEDIVKTATILPQYDNYIVRFSGDNFTINSRFYHR